MIDKYLGRFVTVETARGYYIGTLQYGPTPAAVVVRTGLPGRDPVIAVADVEDVRPVTRARADLEFLPS